MGATSQKPALVPLQRTHGYNTHPSDGYSLVMASFLLVAELSQLEALPVADASVEE